MASMSTKPGKAASMESATWRWTPRSAAPGRPSVAGAIASTTARIASSEPWSGMSADSSTRSTGRPRVRTGYENRASDGVARPPRTRVRARPGPALAGLPLLHPAGPPGPPPERARSSPGREGHRDQGSGTEHHRDETVRLLRPGGRRDGRRGAGLPVQPLLEPGQRALLNRLARREVGGG